MASIKQLQKHCVHSAIVYNDRLLYDYDVSRLLDCLYKNWTDVTSFSEADVEHR